MKVRLETITPSKAKELATTCNGHNRPVRWQWVRKLEDYIRTGRWVQTHQPIAIDTEGNVIDGQHRLHAIGNAGLSVECLVARDVNPDSMEWVDIGIARTDRDNLIIHGMEATNATVAIAKAMLIPSGYHTGKPERNEFREFIEKHSDAIQFSIQHYTGEVAKLAVVRAVAARAWYTEDEKRLIEFAKVLASDEPVSANHRDDKAAIALKRYASSVNTYGSAARVALFEKTQAAIRHFIDRTYVTKLYGFSGNTFKLPEEQ